MTRGMLAAVLTLLVAVPQSVPWWNAAWGRRRAITVTVGANTPQGGYVGYTARLSDLDTAAMIAGGDLLPSGNDLRIVRWDGAGWTDLPRHVVGLNAAATEVRFALAAPIAASGADANYYLYYRNPAAGPPPEMTTTNVYRWFDDGGADRLSSYTNGRVHASGPSNGLTTPSSFAFNAGVGAYEYNTTDNFSESLRPAGVTERDVMVSYDFYQTGAYGVNMASGPLARLTTDGGAPAAEIAAGFYMYLLCDSGANPGAPYAGHGDIAQNAIQSGGGLVDGSGSAIGQVALNAWHSAGLAAWGAGATNLKAWYVNSATSPGLFGATASLTGSQASGDTTAAGAAGLYLCQDIGRVRNILVRRYTEPEPVSALSAAENAPAGGGPPPAAGGGGGGGGGDKKCGCGASGAPGPAAILAAALILVALFVRR